MVNKINKLEEYNEVLNNNYVLIDCYADWCGPCKMLSPIIESLSEQLPNISFNKINVDELDAVKNINAIPCLVLYKQGQEVTRIIGYRDEETLLLELKKVFA